VCGNAGLLREKTPFLKSLKISVVKGIGKALVVMLASVNVLRKATSAAFLRGCQIPPPHSPIAIAQRRRQIRIIT